LSPVVAIAVTAVFHNRFELLVYFGMNSALAAYWLRDCRERKIFVLTGLKVGLLNLLLVAAIAAYTGRVSGAGWMT